MFSSNYLAKPYIKDRSTPKTLSYQDDKKARVTCKLSRGEPLLRFSWFYQKDSDSSAKGGCQKVDNWRPLPSSITLETPFNKTSSSSTIVIPPNIPPVGQPACYKCLAVNEFGNDSLITALHRYSKKSHHLMGINLCE